MYIVQSNTSMSLRAQNTPLRETIARKPPPEPRTAMEGTWKFWNTGHFRSLFDSSHNWIRFKQIIVTRNRTLFHEYNSFVYLFNSPWPSRSKKLLHGLKHFFFPILPKVIFLLTQIYAVPHVRGHRAVKEIRLETLNFCYIGTKFCPIVSERKQKDHVRASLNL